MSRAVDAETLVVGYGNDLRGDDAVGLRVAEGVSSWDLPRVQVIRLRQLVPELAPAVAASARVYFIDADVQAQRVEVRALTAGEGTGTGHAMAPPELLSLTHTVYGVCPPAFMVTLPAAQFELGADLSGTAQAGMQAALALLRAALQ